MVQEGERYKRVVKILRKSKPALKGIEMIEENVVNAIRRESRVNSHFQEFVEHVFAWIYVGWVRRSLVAASVLLVLFFVYQQTIILKGVNKISKLTIVNGAGAVDSPERDLEKQLLILRLGGQKIPSDELEITEKQVKDLTKSYNELQAKYSGLIKIIEEDSVLRNYIEKKLYENKNKVKGKETNL